ncbi:chondroadherin-like [Planococcus citri]|uniref:chondroadherin-like n=1 Tax=Planococcus citri TaxID=170843 RepID=UPI0031F9C7F2
MTIQVVTVATLFLTLLSSSSLQNYYVLAAQQHNCDIREEKLDIIFNCCDKSINDGNSHITLESIQQSVQDERYVNVNRNIHVLMDNNNMSYLKRLPMLSHVTKISFKRNRLADADTGVFRSLPQLKIVDFGCNLFTGDSPTAEIFRGNEIRDRFEPLPLEHLILSNNHITYLHRDLFKYLPNLITLELNDNPLNHFTPDTERALHSLKKLRILNLANVGISHIPNQLFEAIPIETLFLNENNLAEIPNSLSQSSTIRYLSLNENPLREINSKSFAKLIRLQELHISGMKNLSRIEENTFVSLMNLESLTCSFNEKLEFIHPKAFAWRIHRKLKVLNLNNNALRDLPQNLLDWRKLDVLNLRDNPWNCTCSLRWLYDLLEHRQHVYPEANVGIRCHYPKRLRNNTLLFAGNDLICDAETASVLGLSSNRSKDLIVCMIFLALAYVALQLIYFKRMKSKSSPRHSGTSIKSTVKYKPAQSMIYL